MGNVGLGSRANDVGARRANRSVWAVRLPLVAVVLCVLATWLIAPRGAAEELTMPIALQVDLLDRVLRFERNYVARGQDPARVVVVQMEDTPASKRAAAQAAASIEEAGTLGGRNATVVVHTYSSAAALLSASRAAAIVFVMPGFSRQELLEIAKAFIAAKILTVTASSAAVESGLALGFELQSSKPRIVVNLPQARAQGLDFNAQLLRLVRVVQ
jgi:hypothetical protein